MEQMKCKSPAGFTPPTPAELTKAVILGLFCALGIPGNVVVLALLLRKLERNNFTELLMLNLACCDLLYLTALPVWVIHAIRRRDIHPALCRLVSFVVFCSLYVNIFTITLMSVQRFLKVLHHHSRWSQLGQRGERALLVGLWVGSCILTWPSVASTGWTEDRHFECRRSPRMEGLALGATVVELLLGFVIPFSVMTSFYCCLYRRVKERPALSANRRTSQLISRIIVTFLVLWVPIHVVGMVGLVGESLRASWPDLASRLDRFTDRAMIVKNLPLLSAIIDPFLYAYSFSKLWPQNNPNPNPS